MTAPLPHPEPGSLLLRVAEFQGPAITVMLDGVPMEAKPGESVLAAVLTRTDHLRLHEKNGEKRAGFCLMGACQDCWVWFRATGSEHPDRGRACTTLVSEGLQIWTRTPAGVPRIG